MLKCGRQWAMLRLDHRGWGTTQIDKAQESPQDHRYTLIYIPENTLTHHLMHACFTLYVHVQIIAVWQGDFSSTSNVMSFRSKYLLAPDWRASHTRDKKKIEKIKNHEQVVVSAIYRNKFDLDFGFEVPNCFRVELQNGC